MPLSTLQTTPRGVASKTRGQDGFATSFPVGLFHPLQHAGLSRRSPDCRHPCSHLSSEGRGVSGALGRACKSTVSGCSTRTVCLSASVPALGRTRHPFAVSGSEEPSPKIEFVFSASPETIRREPREGNLLRSVGNMQGPGSLRILFILFISAVFYAAVVLRSSAGTKSLCCRS